MADRQQLFVLKSPEKFYFIKLYEGNPKFSTSPFFILPILRQPPGNYCTG